LAKNLDDLFGLSKGREPAQVAEYNGNFSPMTFKHRFIPHSPLVTQPLGLAGRSSKRNDALTAWDADYQRSLAIPSSSGRTAALAFHSSWQSSASMRDPSCMISRLRSQRKSDG
jgi:hypothetical protein